MCVRIWKKNTTKCQYIHFLEEKVLAGTSRANLLCLLQGEESLIPSCSAVSPWTGRTPGGISPEMRDRLKQLCPRWTRDAPCHPDLCAWEPITGCGKQGFVSSTRDVREGEHLGFSLCPCSGLRDGKAWARTGPAQWVYLAILYSGRSLPSLAFKRWILFPVCCSSQLFHPQFRERGEKLTGFQMTSVVL